MSGVKRARTTRTRTGSSSQEQEVADPMMTLERQMEYMRGRPVAKERPVTFSDFDSYFVQDFFCVLVSADRAPEVQLEVQGVQFLFSADVIADFLNCPCPRAPVSRRSWGQEGALTRRFARRAAATAEEASQPSTSASETPMETGAPAVPPPWVAQLFADLDSRVGATMKATLQPVERQMQSLEEQLKELQTAFDGECTVTMLSNKSVVAHMADVNEQLEEIKKTLDDFKMEADPQRIPGDIPDDVATFRDAVRR
ncbi:hypothetical protein CJ030_MR7G017760 [Morella rubra]|uniref:Uncharacterized protein n=1 Tax=Morella rubra TaxID=262757 RepID=A0A6A1V0M2_9ROSI|nr:hypothetical protein CJ030_MR7G017760 [Morella rubra]